MAAPQPPALSGYQPANEVEYQLAHARGDAAVYLRVLRAAMLYVPVLGTEGDARPPSWRHGGVPHVAVFTSLDTMRLRVVGIADAYRVVECADLVAQWPDPTGRLAVNPGTPIGAYLPVAALTDAGIGRSDLVEFDPAWTFPWLVDIRAPEPVINLFTSRERLVEAGYPEERSIGADLIRIVRAWPDTRFWLAVNAGSAIATLIAGGQVAHLVYWAEDLVRRRGIGRVAPVD